MDFVWHWMDSWLYLCCWVIWIKTCVFNVDFISWWESNEKLFVHLVGKMPLQLSLLTHIPTHICFFIWSLLLETWSLEVEDWYCLTESNGTIREIVSHSWDTYWLGTHITKSYWKDRATTLHILFCTYAEGRLMYYAQDGLTQFVLYWCILLG